jgi:DoxX-like family
MRHEALTATGWVLTVVLALVFVASAGMKLLALPYSMRNRERFGMSLTLWRTIGVLELAGVCGMLLGAALPVLGVVAGIGLALLMVGAAVTRLRAHDPAGLVIGDVAVLALVIVYIVVRL